MPRTRKKNSSTRRKRKRSPGARSVPPPAVTKTKSHHNHKFPFVARKFRLPIIIALVLFSIFYWFILRDLPSPQTLSRSDYPISTKILDRNGKLLYEIYDDQNRTPISLSNLPSFVTQATIAIEDGNFYQHHGFDTGGILRAAWKTVTGQRLEGGSTITQQLVKVALLTPERTVSRKIKEAILTVATEILYSKDEILEMYLNHIPYGGTAYGIEAASRRFFGKNSGSLTLPEAALLAGLPQAPSRYSPFGDPDAARARERQVLDRMVAEGYVTGEQAAAGFNEKLIYRDQETDIRAPHFVMYIRKILEDKYGVQRLERGGLRVTTTLDLDLQNSAQASLSAEVGDLAKLKVSNGAAIVTSPKTGEILSMIGSRNYFDTEIDGKVNVTTRDRQPGSSIKPINYALGLETHVITPSTMLLDTPICFTVVGQADYCPKNYDNSFRGPVQIRFALGNSLNIPAVKVLAQNGIENFIIFARKLGIKRWQDPENYGLSLTLGGGEVQMTEMATAFGTFANSGTTVPLVGILKVEDSYGVVLEEYNPREVADIVTAERDTLPSPGNPALSATYPLQKTLSPQTSFLISHILSDNNARSGAFGSNSVLVIPGKTVSVKTGTTNNLRDNWTIGYTEDRLTAVWVGNNDNTPMSYVASGITGASPIWADIMKYALIGLPNTEIYKPKEGIEGFSVCTVSGAMPDATNPCETRFEYFIKGTVPTVQQITKRNIFVNRDTHHPPTSEAEFGNVEEKEQTVASDPFVKDYCQDCEPYPEGYKEPPTIFPYTPSAFNNTAQ